MTPAPNGEQKGYALVIGVGAVNKTKYDGWDGKDETCVNDAQQMATFARERGFLLLAPSGDPSKDNEPLLTEKATRLNVISMMEQAKTLEPGDFLLVHFSGHGGRDPKGPPSAVIGEYWSLYDGPLHDDEWDHMLAKIPEGVRVVVLSDSCWSGGFGPPDDEDPPGLVNIRFTRESEHLCIEARAGKTRAVPKNKRAAIRRVTPRLASPDDIPATVILLAACHANQQAYSGRTHGVFTNALLDVLTEHPSGLSYNTLYHEVGRKITCPLQSPFCWKHGAGAFEFAKEKAFSIAQPQHISSPSLPAVGVPG